MWWGTPVMAVWESLGMTATYGVIDARVVHLFNKG
jgi:hypothetical protein